MNPKSLGGSIWLLLFGAASVLLIGAFARFDSGGQSGVPSTNAPALLPEAARPDAAEPEPAPTVVSTGLPALPADLSPGLAEIIKLAQAHIADDTILAYIQNSGLPYNPSADEILYLSDLGVSDKIVAALLKKPDAAVAATPVPEAPPAVTVAPEPPPVPAGANPGMAAAPENMIDIPAGAEEEAPPLQNPQDSYFYDGLAPYGNWVQTGDGWGWQPMVASVDAGWLPYRDRGHWALTDDGWYWASDYSWGWAAFHYGRWSHHDRFGWVWVPGNVWAPAWVAWRHTEGFAGWAPLPPDAHFRHGVGLFAGAGRGGFNVSYGLRASWFTFVPHEHFLARNLGHFAAPAGRATALFQSSTPVNNYSFSGRRILNVGVSAGQIAAVTKTPVPKFTIKEASSPVAAAGRSGGQSLAVFRPNVAAPAVRPPAETPTRPVLINRTPRPATTATAIPRGVPNRPATVASDFSVQAPRPSDTASPARPGFISGNFQPPAARRTPSPAAPAAPVAGISSLTGGGDARRIAIPTKPAPAAGYPSYSQRGFNPAPSSVPGTAPSYNPPPRNSPGYSTPPSAPQRSAPAFSVPPSAPQRSAPAFSVPASAPQHTAPAFSAPAPAPPHIAPASSPPPSAPAASHGGGGQSSQGGGSSSSSSKTSK